MRGKDKGGGSGKGLVYLAGPAYSPEEVHALEIIAAQLERNGWEVYLPATQGLERDCLPGGGDAPRGNNVFFFRDVLERAAFALEIYQVVERCDALVFSLNGRVPDEGGVFKTAVAFAAGKTLVLYKRDHRSKLHGNDNAMIPGLSFGFRNVKKAKKLAAELDAAAARTASYHDAPYTTGSIPPLMRLLVAQGRQVWELLPQRGAPDFYEDLAQVMTTSTL